MHVHLLVCRSATVVHRAHLDEGTTVGGIGQRTVVEEDAVVVLCGEAGIDPLALQRVVVRQRRQHHHVVVGPRRGVESHDVLLILELQLREAQPVLVAAYHRPAARHYGVVGCPVVAGQVLKVLTVGYEERRIERQGVQEAARRGVGADGHEVEVIAAVGVDAVVGQIDGQGQRGIRRHVAQHRAEVEPYATYLVGVAWREALLAIDDAQAVGHMVGGPAELDDVGVGGALRSIWEEDTREARLQLGIARSTTAYIKVVDEEVVGAARRGKAESNILGCVGIGCKVYHLLFPRGSLAEPHGVDGYEGALHVGVAHHAHDEATIAANGIVARAVGVEGHHHLLHGASLKGRQGRVAAATCRGVEAHRLGAAMVVDCRQAWIDAFRLTPPAGREGHCVVHLKALAVRRLHHGCLRGGILNGRINHIAAAVLMREPPVPAVTMPVAPAPVAALLQCVVAAWHAAPPAPAVAAPAAAAAPRAAAGRIAGAKLAATADAGEGKVVHRAVGEARDGVGAFGDGDDGA